MQKMTETNVVGLEHDKKKCHNYHDEEDYL